MLLSDDTFPAPLTRRDFCAHAGRAASLIAIGALVPACGGGSSPTSASSAAPIATVNGSAVTGGVVVTIDSASPLASVGGAAQVRSSSGSFLVARTGQDTFTALTTTCTHEACTIAGFESNAYVCPCHGSRFDTSGRVLNGPATRALASFSTQFVDGVLTIRT